MLYRLYIDESGDHTYGKKVSKEWEPNKEGNVIGFGSTNEYPELEIENRRYLALLGCIIESTSYRERFCPALSALKSEIFDEDPDLPVILHRDDIVKKRGYFRGLTDLDLQLAFNERFLRFIREMSFTTILVMIDKRGHVGRYGSKAYHPYHYCLTAMLERYCGFLKIHGAPGDVMAESRGGREDMRLKQAYSDLFAYGSRFRPPSFFQKTLSSKQLKLKRKDANIAGLQLADLLAYPLKMEYLREEKCSSSPCSSEFENELCQCAARKFNYRYGTGEVAGYGKVFLK